MSKHTPGPWQVGHGTLRIVHLDHENKKGICVADAEVVNDDYEIAQANARLIAAAPTMYEYIASSASNGCATAKKILESINGHA